MMLLIGLLIIVLCAVGTAGTTSDSAAAVAEAAGNSEMAGEFRTCGCLLMILVGAVGLLMVGALFTVIDAGMVAP